MAKKDDILKDIDTGTSRADETIQKINRVADNVANDIARGGRKADETIQKIDDEIETIGTAVKYGSHSLGLDQLADKNITMSRQRGNTIASLAKSNIFEFPVFVSDTVSIDKMTALNQLLEQLYGSYLQMAISLNPVADIDTVKSGDVFAGFKTDTNRYLEHTDMTYAHDACHNVIQEGAYSYEFTMISISDKDARIINEHCNYEPLSEFDHFFQEANHPVEMYNPDQERYDDKGNYQGHTVNIPSEMERRRMDTDLEHVQKQINDLKNKIDDHALTSSESKKSKAQLELDKLENEIKQITQNLNDPKYNKDYRDKVISQLEKEIRQLDTSELKNRLDMKRIHAQLTDARQKLKDHDEDRQFKRNDERRAAERHLHDTKLKAPSFVDETKLQKLNTMKPYMMTVSMSVADTNGGISRPMDYIVGVKTYCRIIDSSILPEMVEYPSKEMNQLSRKAKWRAGELKFFEYLFHIKAKKQTAIDSRDPKRKWYRRLYELAHIAGDAKAGKIIGSKRSVNGLRKSLMSNNALHGVMPNVTLVMTQGDVDNIKAETNIDVLKASVARNLCNELFLISLVVIDEDKEAIKIMIPDLHNDYEIHSMASLNKQIAMLDSSKAIGLNDILGKNR